MAPSTCAPGRALRCVLLLLCVLVPGAAFSQTITLNGAASATVAPAESVVVQVTGSPGNPIDWIGLYVAGSTNPFWLDWRYMNGTRQAPATGLTSGTMTLTMPTGLASYEVRLISGSSGAVLATSGAITVTGSGVQGVSLAFGVPAIAPVNPSAGGTGADGPLELRAPFNCQTTVRSGRSAPDCVATALRGPAAAGQAVVPVASAVGFNAGDEVLIAQMVNGVASVSEVATVAAVTTGHITVTSPLVNAYTAPVQTAVTWTNQTGAISSGNTLTNASCTTQWACGGISTQSIVSGDGYVEFSASPAAVAMGGLGVADTNQSYTDLEFGLYANSGTLYISESGWLRGSVGAYAAGDRLRVSVEGGVVTYRRNGALLYRSHLAPSYPLVLDTSMLTAGAAISNAVLAAGSATAQVVRVPNFSTALLAGNAVSDAGWSFVSPGIAVTGNSLSAASSPGWSGGAVSDVAMFGGDGWAEFTVNEIDYYKMGGLGDAGPIVGTASVAFGVMFSPGGGVYVVERGLMKGGGAFGYFAAGDTFRVAIENGQVVYRQNGTAFYTSTVAPSYPLRFVGELYSAGASITNVRVQSAPSLTAKPWDGHTGGAFILRARDSFVLGPASAVYLGQNSWRGSLPAFVTVNGSSGSTTVATGSTLAVHVSGGIGRASDLLGLYHVGGSEVLNWWYLNGTQTPPASPLLTASLNLPLPGTPGTFELRLSGPYRSAVSAAISAVPTVIVNGVPPSSTVSIEPGATLTAQVSGGSGQPGERVELHLAGAAGWLDWRYLSGTQVLPPSGTTSGTVTFSAPQSLGIYVIQFYSTAGTLIASSAPIAVSGTGQAGLTLQFGSGTSNSENEIGSGANGALDLSAPFNCQRMTRPGRSVPDCVALPIVESVPAGTTTIGVRTSAGFAAGDEVIVTQMTGAGAGTREYQTVASTSGTQLILNAPLTNAYQVPAPQAVTWTGMSGAIASGNTLSNTACSGAWNCGGVSTQSIASGDGYVEFSASAAAAAMGGLGSANADQSYFDIEFALYANAGTLYVYESGWQRSLVGTYTASDRLRVSVEAGIVTYRKNGELLYRSGIVPAYPLSLDTSLQTAGGVISNAVLGAGNATAQVVRVPNYTTVSIGGQGVSNVGWWYSSNGVSTVSNSVQSGSCTGWSCGAVSDFVLRSAGYAEFSVTETAYYKMAGLGDSTLSGGTGSVAYGVMLSPGGGVYVMERGVMRGTGAFGYFAPGDTFRVGIENGQVVYRQNGAVLYVSGVPPVYPLHLIAEVYEPGAQIVNARLFAPGTLTGNTWDGLTGGIFSLRVRDTIVLGGLSSVNFGSSLWQGQVCAYGVTPQQVTSIVAAGASGALTVSTPPGCTWIGVSNTPWITASATGRGSGTFSYVVAANTSDAGRAGSISVTGQTQPVVLTQRGTCDYSMAPTQGAAFPVAGGAGSYTVSPGSSACSWSATSNASWLTVTNGTGRSGAGNFAYVVSANPDPIPRSATITMNDVLVPITQSANCQFNVAPGPGGMVSPLGADAYLAWTSNGATCGWTMSTDVSWITIAGATSGTGSGGRWYTVAANLSSSGRVGHVLIAGQSIAVTQSGVPREMITNGAFEQGFRDADPQHGTGQVANFWQEYTNSNHSSGFLMGGIATDRKQHVAGDLNDGLVQWVSLPPGVPYVLVADVFVQSGGAKIYMHTLGGLDPVEVLTTRPGATRLRLPFTQQHYAYGPLNAVIAVYAAAAGSDIRIDNVTLRTVADAAADERVVNGDFSLGFHTIGDANGSGALGNSWTHLGQSTPPQGVFGTGGPVGNLWQSVESGSFGTGLQQVVTLQANQKYLIHANVKMDGGGVQLAVGPSGGVESQQIYLCGSQSPWHELQTIFTPAYTGQYTIAMKSLFADSSYSADDISISPTTLTDVQTSTAGPGTPCIQMHSITFEVHDSLTQQPVEGATVEIAPNFGSPPRITYPDGTIGYQVGQGTLQFTIAKSGYQTNAGSMNITGSSTRAVALSPAGATGCTPTLSPSNISVPTTASSVTITIPVDAGCSWTASTAAGFISFPSGSSGMGAGSVTLAVSANDAAERTAAVWIGNARLLVTQLSDSPGYNPLIDLVYYPDTDELGFIGSTRNELITEGYAAYDWRGEPCDCRWQSWVDVTLSLVDPTLTPTYYEDWAYIIAQAPNPHGQGGEYLSHPMEGTWSLYSVHRQMRDWYARVYDPEFPNRPAQWEFVGTEPEPYRYNPLMVSTKVQRAPQLKIFLDVPDAAGNYNFNPQASTNGQDDAPQFVPGSFLNGLPAQISDSQSQSIRVIAAYVDANGQIVPPPDNGQVSFLLAETSAFVGYAMNAGTSTAQDYLLASPSATFENGNIAQVQLNVRDYGGFTRIVASHGGSTSDLKVPKDVGNNWIPDSGWKATANNSVIGVIADQGSILFRDSDQDSSPAGDGTNGDGLTVFEEYRGFIVRGEHRRTDPGFKDVFIDSDLPTNIGYAVNLPVTKHWVRPDELSLVMPSKLINSNYTNPGTGGNIPGHTHQHGIVVRDRAEAPVSGLYGDARCPVPCTPNTPEFGTNEVAPAEVYTSSIANIAPDADAWYRGNMKTTAHEIGHKIGMRHYNSEETPRRTVMISAFYWADAAWTDIPTTYDAQDITVIKVKGQ